MFSFSTCFFEKRKMPCCYMRLYGQLVVILVEQYLSMLFVFQGYPSELLPVTVQGIPSIHICLDYIPEMLSQPQLDKQVS